MERIDYLNKLIKISASCWSLLSKRTMMQSPENVQNKHRPLKQACQPPNACINRTYTMHILSYMAVPF
jgi:hypothetical protein